MINEYISALLLIFVAEMGDKTQILAMMFATKYKTSKVLVGIFIGSFLNHGLAVLFGSLIGGVINPNILQVVAGIAFIGFAFWTLLAGDDDEDSNVNMSKGAIVTVALAFFVGELGDKTQLTAITLSIDSVYPLLVLFGTVSGMIVTSSLGIVVGSKLGDKIPELMIKLLSSAVFLIFGVIKLVSSTPYSWRTPLTVVLFITVISVGFIFLTVLAIKGYKSGELTPLRYAAKQLYEIEHQNLMLVEDLCKTVNHCGTCAGTKCGIGLIKHILADLKDEDFNDNHMELLSQIKKDENKFSHVKLVHMLESNLEFLIKYKYRNEQYQEVDNIRKAVEVLLFERYVEFNGDLDKYLSEVGKNDLNLKNELTLFFNNKTN